MNRWKHELYEKAQIGIPHGDTEANNLVIFGFMMAQFIADFRWQLSRKYVDNEEDKSPHVSFKRFSSLRPFSFEFLAAKTQLNKSSGVLSVCVSSS